MTENTKSILLALTAVLSWSTVATAFKIALDHLSVFNMLFIATWTTLVVLAAVLCFEGKWREISKMPRSLIAKTAGLGLLNPVVYYLILFQAYDLLPAQMAQPLNYAWPIVLLILLSVFNHQKISILKFIGMLISVSGVVVISLGGGGMPGGASPGGIALALFSAVIWATYWFLNDRLKGKVDTTVALFLGFLAGAIVLSIAGIFVGIEIKSLEGFMSGIYIGYFEMGIPFVSFGIALRSTNNPTLINQLCYLSPFLSLFFISIVLGETIVAATYIGLALIVAGLIFNQYQK